MPPVTLGGREGVEKEKKGEVSVRGENDEQEQDCKGGQLTSWAPADGFPARQVGDVDERVVEGGEDVGHAEHQLAVPHLRAQRDLHLLLGLSLSLPGRHATSAMVASLAWALNCPNIGPKQILEIISPDYAGTLASHHET